MTKKKEKKWLQVPDLATHNEFEQGLVELVNEVRNYDDSEDIENAFNDAFDNVTHEYIENMYKLHSLKKLSEEDSDDEHAWLNAIEVGLEHDISRDMDVRDVVDEIFVEITTGNRPKKLTSWESSLMTIVTVPEQEVSEDGRVFFSRQDTLLETRDEVTQDYLNKLKQLEAIEDNPQITLKELRNVKEVEDVDVYSEVRDATEKAIHDALSLKENLRNSQ